MAYIDKYGVEFTDDCKTLIRCPENIKGMYSVPNRVEKITSHAFANCKGLTAIVCSENLKSIENSAFEGCINLTSIETPPEIIISSKAFIGCLRLKTIFPFGHIIDKHIHIRVHYSYESQGAKRGGFWGRSVTTRSKILIDKSVKLDMQQIGVMLSFMGSETTDWEEIDAYNNISPNEYLRNDKESTQKLVSILGESFEADFESCNLVDIYEEYEPVINYYIACGNNVAIYNQYISQNIDLPYNLVAYIHTHLNNILNSNNFTEVPHYRDIYTSNTSKEYYNLLKTEIAQYRLDINEKYGIMLVCKTLKQIVTEILRETHLKEICSMRKEHEYKSARINKPINKYEQDAPMISVSGTSLYHHIRNNIKSAAGITYIELYPLDLALLFNDYDFYEFLMETGAYATEYAAIADKLKQEEAERRKRGLR